MESWLTTIALAAAVWWLGTGVVLYLQQTLSRHSVYSKGSLIFIGALCIQTLWWTQHLVTGLTTSVSFIAAVVLWGILELSYYLGFITGVHKRPCPKNAIGWKRFRLALGASIWHELTALGIGLCLVAILIKADNPTGLYTYLVLWLMRWSAKLNLFLGVPHFQPDWFPSQMDYLKTYLKQTPVSWFFPVSLALSFLLMTYWIQLSFASSGAAVLTHSLPAALLALAIIEHGLMALPLTESRLWNGLFNTHKNSSSRAKR